MSLDDALLLGGAGFIGSSLARNLEQEKRIVYIPGRQDGVVHR